MVNSYLGVLSHCGLEELTDETEHAARFLARRCYGRGVAHSVLCWATLDVQDAEIIRQLTRLGLFSAALWRLAADAYQWGSLPPTDDASDAA